MERVTDPAILAQFNNAPAESDTDPSVWGTVKQVPLGIARGLTHMLEAGAASGMAEAQAMNPKFGADDEARAFGESKLPELQDFQKQGHEALTNLGVEGENSPKNAWERAASAAGESLPWAPMTGPLGLPGTAAIGAVGAAGGSLASEFADDENKPIANVIGSLVSSLGAAGALRLGEGLVNMLRPRQRMLNVDGLQVPATKGTIPEDLGRKTPQQQIGEEQHMSGGTKGLLAQNVMERNRTAREQALQAERESIGADIGGNPINPNDAADVVSHGVRTRADELKSGADKLYSSAREKNAWVVADQHNPQTYIDDFLTKNNVKLDNVNYPAAQSAMSLIKTELSPGTAVGEIGSAVDNMGPRVVSVQQMDSVRRGLIRLKGVNAEDNRALGAITQAYDGWVNGAVDRALFVGDKTALDDIKQARGLWRRYRQMTDADPRNDYTKIISEIVEKDRTPQEVSNMLFSMNSLQQGGRASRLARYLRRAFGEDSQEWQALRQGFLHRAFDAEEARIANVTGPQGARASASRIIQMIDSPLARVLFSPQELGRLRRYREVLLRTNPPSINPPNSGMVSARAMWGIMQGAAGAVGVGYGYHSGDWKTGLAIAAAPLIRDASGLRKALAATTQRRMLPALGARGVIPALAPGLTRPNEEQ